MTKAHLFQIRRFHPRDLDGAARAANAACWQAYAIFGYDYPVARTRSRLKEALAEGQDFWIPEIDGIVAGVLTLLPNFIDKLFLAPQWQGLGIGSALIAKAKALFPDCLELHCAQLNSSACRFYERHGFTACEHRIYAPMGVADIVYRWEGR
jgi:GNAT superfamily N-acetyltransferase